MEQFVHLRLHSEFSITDSIVRIKDAVSLASQDNMVALAQTDLHNLFGMVKFYKACRENGVKPVIGSEVNIISEDDFKYRILVLAKNINGYRELCELLTMSYIENKILDIPYIKEDWLFNGKYCNLIILSGAHNGDIGQLILQNKYAEARKKAKFWAKYFPDNYYLELQRIMRSDAINVVEESIKIASELNLPVVATHPIQFIKASDYIAHEVRICIADGELLDNEKRQSKFCEEQYFLNQKEMIARFKDIPSAIANSVEIAKRCNLEITLDKYFLPDFVTPKNLDSNEYLKILAKEGLEKRLDEIFLKDSEEERKKFEAICYERLANEIDTIIQMGFAGYFLIVADFINWAKQNNIPVGAGRGSGAGSLVAFALRITGIEPLRYGLLFERFLNPERISMPDFDIDFCQDKRELVIEYVKNKYGRESVAQIATFGTMSSKAVIKDVGRALALPYTLCDSISKLIINTPAKSYSLLEAYEKFPELKEKIDNADDEVKRLWELSLQLEDLTRSVGKHAAGVLIAPTKLTNFCPIYLADGMQTSQLDMSDVEKIGLVKFDFLGLRNLTIIQETLESVKELYNENIQLSNYDFADEKVYELLRQGNTASVFQLESHGMRRVLTKLEPDRFDDIIAVGALYRPGPLGSGMVDDFIKRKKGESLFNFFHDDLKECLEPTYGVIVYQEQVLQIAQIIGGYTLGGADLLRRAMGKKKPEEMALHKNIFVEGALKKGYSKDLAIGLFDIMAKFAEYGFNKSHSAAYAVISYHTAYLKAHYLTCFMASTLSSELDKTDKLYELYQDCIDNEIVILPPDINYSSYRFKAIDNKTIRYALGAVKGVGKSIVSLVEKERSDNGEFKDFVDFCLRMDKKHINKRALESLVKAGAFDTLENNRNKLLNNIPKILNEIEDINRNANQGSLFEAPTIELQHYETWTLKEQLNNEKQAIGYYLSASLFDEYQDIVRKLNVMPLSKFSIDDEDVKELIYSPKNEKTKVLVCGIINNIGSRPLKKGGKIVFVNIEDDSSMFEFVVFNETYERYKHLIKIDEMVFIEGELMFDSFRNQVKITAGKIYTLDEILKENVKQVQFNISHDFVVEKLTSFLEKDGANIVVNYFNEKAKCKIEFGSEHRLLVNYSNLSKLNILLGKNAWSII